MLSTIFSIYKSIRKITINVEIDGIMFMKAMYCQYIPYIVGFQTKVTFIFYQYSAVVISCNWYLLKLLKAIAGC